MDVFEIRQQALVELCDAFETSFGRPAKLSFTRHGPRLERIFARFDRFTGPAGSRGAGLREARTLVQTIAEESRQGVRSAAQINSLAWFVPILDQASKDRRRWWKRWHKPRRAV